MDGRVLIYEAEETTLRARSAAEAPAGGGEAR